MTVTSAPRFTLAELLPGLSLSDAVAKTTISGLTLDSRKVEQGDLFCAIKGHQQDGRRFAADAVALGAAAVLWDDDGSPLPQLEAPIIPVADLSNEVSAIADQFYFQPSQRLQIFGVTGTNGKTTVTFLLAQLLSLLGKRAGVMGTLGFGELQADQSLVNTGLTTPDPIAVQQHLAAMAAEGISAVAMEVSSHSLVQRRVAAVDIGTAVFTNLSQDHLDYHGDFHQYAAAKARLFAMPSVRLAVINFDDAVGRLIMLNMQHNPQLITYSISNPDAIVYCTRVEQTDSGTVAELVSPWGVAQLQSPLLGEFNLSNVLAVIAVLCSHGYALEAVLEMLPKLQSVPGRMEKVEQANSPTAVIDYAHTPDALEKVLATLRHHCRGKLWCVFGCGGDRDSGKRPLMGAIAGRLADAVVVTSDNPRTENPDAIIQQIAAGVGELKPLQLIEDRDAAIGYAIANASDQDWVLVAGKGHEDYQIIGTQSRPFSDRDTVRKHMQRRGAQQ